MHERTTGEHQNPSEKTIARLIHYG